MNQIPVNQPLIPVLYANFNFNFNYFKGYNTLYCVLIMMDDSRENSVLNSIDRGVINEQAEHNTCVANKCMTVR